MKRSIIITSIIISVFATTSVFAQNHDHISNKYYKDEYNINYKNKKKYNSYSSNECHSNNNRKDHHNHHSY